MPGSSLARLALLVERPLAWMSQETLVREFLGVVKAVGKEENAIKLRSGRLLAWARTCDLSQVGYPSWTAFAKEFSPWRGSRTRDFVRLVESRLDVIKEAAGKDEIELTVATRAPRELGPDASREVQLAWMAAATFRALPVRDRAFMVRVSGDALRRVTQARALAAKLVGWDAPIAAIDAFLFDCYERKLTGQQILERARAAPPKPARLGGKVPDWKDDPSVSLLGPWVEPTDLRDVIAKLRSVEVLLDQRRMLLGVAYFLVRFHYLWTSVPGCDSLDVLCLAHLHVSRRTFQRYAREGLHHLQRPESRTAIEAGRLTVDRAIHAAEHAGSSDLSLRRWLDVVRRLGRAELERAVEENGDRTAEVYAPVLDMAREVEAIARKAKASVAGEVEKLVRDGTAAGSPAPGDDTSAFGDDSEPRPNQATEIAGGLLAAARASEVGGTAARIAAHLLATGARGAIQLARRDDANRRSTPRPPPERRRVPPNLLAAADYLLSVVSLPKESGSRKVVERDGFVCQNPRCRRLTLRVHHHHLVERQHGGTDDPANIVTLCPACHLRGIHSGRMSVVRIGNWLVWSWPHGGVVLMASPVTELLDSRGRAVAPVSADAGGPEVRMIG